MLNEFINAYKMRYFKIFSDDFYGRFKAYENALLEPKFHPSVELENELKWLDLVIKEPILVAIVGQFSSGKSTFLNTILGKNILPTGVVPVTSRLTYIKYAPNYSLRVDYENGRELSLDIKEIANFVDQRIFGDDVKTLTLYAPNEILKSVNFVDTPGLNSLSASDTNITKNALNSVCGVIWLSLIDNAARASELKSLNEFLNDDLKFAVCVLNQMDKLNKDELENALNHAKNTYDKFFNHIVAISAKNALTALNNGDDELFRASNFGAIFEILDEFKSDDKKHKFVLNRCEKIAKILQNEYEFFAEIFSKADEILDKNAQILNEKIAQIKSEFALKIELSFNEIKEVARFISTEISGSLKPVKKVRFVPKKQLFGGEIFIKNEYEMMDFDVDEILSKLIYNDTRLSKIFRIYRRNLKLLEDEILNAFDEIYAVLERDFMIYKSEFENIRKENAVGSSVNFANLRAYASGVYELFLRDFESVKSQKKQKISLFFEKLNLKVVTNYENAVKIAVYFLKDKIKNAQISYEKDPNYFSLFIPSGDEIFSRVLISLNLYEFENEMLANSSFLNKILGELDASFKDLKSQKTEKIAWFLSQNEALKSEILKISSDLKAQNLAYL
ncbi:dynamin family protein [Campylobacter gastrosuis]|uniref:Dynamin family protein n=1 Tax=Campylobacter gastrosuis TaxID=2974576 RepID=A0ABT7HPQ5_9BACT|nr:dynamin family protein [Campylobacter gastrosuis]MDL0088418.1 dynamin family protein [Campylobacter gastrosuis]